MKKNKFAAKIHELVQNMKSTKNISMPEQENDLPETAKPVSLKKNDVIDEINNEIHFVYGPPSFK